MKKRIGIALAILIGTSAFAQKNQTEKLELDKNAIKEMIGCYKVTFEFAETFAPDTAYEYYDRKFDWGIEYVALVEETDKKISLQHLLIVNDTFIIKHWRQDWIYENRDILSFLKDNEWKKISLSPEQAKGTWTQKVYQVDDSPRYEGYGTWVHVDGKHYWESTADAPLPRREFSKRSDYNVLKRHSRMEITDDGWVLEQDNEKIIRDESGDKLLCWEKGVEKFIKGDFDCQPGIDWWENNGQYWADVRTAWEEVYNKYGELRLQKKVDDKHLFEQLFATGDIYANAANYNSAEAKTAIKNIIHSYIITN